MKAFNAFYYSFSPTVASVVGSSPLLTETTRILLYPLVAILRASSIASSSLTFAPELRMVTMGLFAAALLGAVYLTPLVVGVKYLARRSWIKRAVRQAISER